MMATCHAINARETHIRRRRFCNDAKCAKMRQLASAQTVSESDPRACFGLADELIVAAPNTDYTRILDALSR